MSDDGHERQESTAYYAGYRAFAPGMTERIAPLLRWAEGYYPSRLIEPPDIGGMNLTDAELIELFARVPSRRAHHALVDQPTIRNRLSVTAMADAALAAWQRTQ